MKDIINAVQTAYLLGYSSSDRNMLSRRPDGTKWIVPSIECESVYYLRLDFDPGTHDIKPMTGVRLVTEAGYPEVIIYGHDILKRYFGEI